MPKKILFVTSFPPFPMDRSGGGIRSRLLLDALAECGQVSIFYLNYRGADHDLQKIPGSPFGNGTLLLSESVLIPGHGSGKVGAYAAKAFDFVAGRGMAAAGLRVSKEARRLMGEMIDRGDVDLVVGRLSRPTAVAGLLEERRVPLIVDADDWEPSRTIAQIRATPAHNVPLRIFLRRYLQGSQALGDRLLERADHVWLASEADTSMLARPNVTTLPNLPLAKAGESIAPLDRSARDSKTLFAVGQWSRSQNSDGMKWFLRNVWPLLVERMPEVELRISGDTPEALAREWRALPNVRPLGFVDDLRAEYDKAALVAAPITWGGGTKIKVLEALAYGRVPVGPDHAFDGLADVSSIQAIAAVENDPARTAETIASLLDDPQARHAREVAAVEYYRENYSVAAFNRHVRNTVEQVIGLE